jgi:hypothetical protein
MKKLDLLDETADGPEECVISISKAVGGRGGIMVGGWIGWCPS